MITEIKKFIRIMFYIPTVIIIGIYSAILTYKRYRNGQLDINNKVELYKEMSDTFERTREYGFHISMIFWIILLFLITI